MDKKIEAYLAGKKKAAQGVVADRWQRLEALYANKLWHELTLEVRTFVYDPAIVKGLNLKEFYDSFIIDFAHRINALAHVEIALPVIRQVFSRDKEAAYEFIKTLEKPASKDPLAKIRLQTGHIELRLAHKDKNDRCVDIGQVRSLIENTQKLLDDLVGVREVHAPFYKVSAVYLKEVGDYAGYYRESLRYLGVEDVAKLSDQEKYEQALLVGFAALLGEDVYNFGELLAHPILRSLEGRQEAWLIDVLFSFNAGDIEKFVDLEKMWGQWDDLKKQKEFLVSKLRLLCVMELALARPSKERYIGFVEIATKAQVDVSQVEFLVMKALSKGLISGAIDQVNRTVHVTWVQPRVLSPAQILNMADRIGTWCTDVAATEKLVCENAREILTKT